MRPFKLVLILGTLVGLQFVVSNPAQAAETPYARTCRQAGGQAWSVSLSSPEDIPLCRFDRAAIGAAEFAAFKWSHAKADSITAILNSAASEGGPETCSLFRARYAEAKDSDDITWALCVFADDSVAEVNTLARGTDSPQNASLVRTLR
jgi:hypothetical protein